MLIIELLMKYLRLATNEEVHHGITTITIFLVAAQYQHMTKAAEHLQIAQPALSQAIHRLEAELGVPLFERKNRSIELNDEGKFLQNG